MIVRYLIQLPLRYEQSLKHWHCCILVQLSFGHYWWYVRQRPTHPQLGYEFVVTSTRSARCSTTRVAPWQQARNSSQRRSKLILQWQGVNWDIYIFFVWPGPKVFSWKNAKATGDVPVCCNTRIPTKHQQASSTPLASTRSFPFTPSQKIYHSGCS
jgi:hypothetical protein